MPRRRQLLGPGSKAHLKKHRTTYIVGWGMLVLGNWSAGGTQVAMPQVIVPNAYVCPQYNAPLTPVDPPPYTSKEPTRKVSVHAG
jgi:hypothetical protein